MSDVIFKVDKKNKVVVCKLTNCREIAINRVYKYCCNFFGHTYDIYIPDTYTGVARCSSDDTFDISFGKELALTRAKAKRGKAINAAINKYIKNVRHELDLLEKHGIHTVPEVNFED